MIWARDFGSTKASESPEYFVYCELFEMNCWSKRSAQIAKGEFLEVPVNLKAGALRLRRHIALAHFAAVEVLADHQRHLEHDGMIKLPQVQAR